MFSTKLPVTALMAAAMFVAAGAGASAKGVMLMNRIGPSKMELFVANADGSGERRLLPDSHGLDYDASFSADGRWIVFTSERDPEGFGQADIWRVHPDGSGLERLTSGPSMEDAGVLSPDGTKLAFVSTKGGIGTTNIWVMDLVSKKARNLTGDGRTVPSQTMNSYFRPAWSPDGRWLAFSSDRGNKWAGAESGTGIGHSHAFGVYVVPASGGPLRPISSTADGKSDGSPKWSPDGTKVLAYEVAIKDGMTTRMGHSEAMSAAPGQIVEIDVATRAKTVLTSGPGLKTSPQFLPGGLFGYVLKGSPRGGAPAAIVYSTGKPGPQGAVRSPSWSPDGTQVVYQRFDTTNPTQYTRLYSWDKAREYRYTDVFPTLCAKSGKLALTDLNFPIGNPTASISVMNPDGSDKKKVFQRQDGAALMPTWSPDCQWIAFGFGSFFGARDFKPAGIRMVKFDGSETREVVSGPVNMGFPAWSPDGHTLVYRVWGKVDGKDVRGLRSYDLVDHTTRVLTTDWDNFPFFSPSGDRIAFTRRMPDADFEVFTMKPDGTDQRRLTATRGADAHATWSTDGSQLWFESSRSGFKDEGPLYDTSPQPYAQVYLMNRDGSHVRKVTDSKWEDSMGMYLPDK